MAIRSPHWEIHKTGPWPESPSVERLTASGVEFLAKNGFAPPKDLARADAVSQGDGLRMTTTYDFSGRPTYEFTSTTGRKNWMDRYKCVPQEALAWNVKNLPFDQFEARRDKHLADMQLREKVLRDLASGKFRGIDLDSGLPL
jgi:hypothetical protein